MTCEPPNSPWIMITIGDSAGTSGETGGVISTLIQPPSGTKMYFLSKKRNGYRLCHVEYSTIPLVRYLWAFILVDCASPYCLHITTRNYQSRHPREKVNINSHKGKCHVGVYVLNREGTCWVTSRCKVMGPSGVFSVADVAP